MVVGLQWCRAGCLACFLLLVLPVPAHAGEGSEPDLKAITKRLEAWRVSFVNLRFVYESRSQPGWETVSENWPPSSDTRDARLFSRTEVMWADHGLYLLDSRHFSRDGTVLRSIDVFNGPGGVAFRATYKTPAEGVEAFTALDLVGMQRGKPTSRMAVTPLSGLYWPGTAEWLPELMPQWTWTQPKSRPVRGDICVELAGTEPSSRWKDVFWLDTTHELLVKRLRKEAFAEQRYCTEFIVDDFQQLEGGIWFPKRGRLQIQSRDPENQFWEVTEAAVNVDLPLARFDPPSPVEGTIVTDVRVGRTWRAGSAALPDNAGAGKATDSHSPNAPSARPPASMPRWIAGSLFALALLLVLLAIGLTYRGREKGK